MRETHITTRSEHTVPQWRTFPSPRRNEVPLSTEIARRVVPRSDSASDQLPFTSLHYPDPTFDVHTGHPVCEPASLVHLQHDTPMWQAEITLSFARHGVCSLPPPPSKYQSELGQPLSGRGTH